MTTALESPAFQRLEAEGRLLKPALVEALGPSIKAGGKYFIYVSDLDRASRYQIDFLYLDKTKMKKMATAHHDD
jgi:hypothetical protein